MKYIKTLVNPKLRENDSVMREVRRQQKDQMFRVMSVKLKLDHLAFMTLVTDARQDGMEVEVSGFFDPDNLPSAERLRELAGLS